MSEHLEARIWDAIRYAIQGHPDFVGVLENGEQVDWVCDRAAPAVLEVLCAEGILEYPLPATLAPRKGVLAG